MTLFTLLSLTYPNLTFSYVPLLCTTLHSCIATSLSHSLHNTHIIHSSHTEPKCSLNRLLLDHIFNNEAMSLSSPPPQSSFLARKTHPVFTISLSVILVFSHLLLHCSDHSFSSRLVSSRLVLYLSNSTIATLSGTAVGHPNIILRHVTKYSVRSSHFNP